MPPQSTTASQAIGPALVSTPVTAPSRVRTRVTVTFSRSRAPPARAPAADEAGGVPGGAAGERAALQQQDVGDAELREVIGDAGADHPAADDHDAGVLGHRGSSVEVVHACVRRVTPRSSAQ